MNFIIKHTLILIASGLPMTAETVILTTVPDDARPLEPLTTLGGIPLDASAQVRLGAFPGMDDDALLDLSASGGLDAVDAAFVPFGAVASVGQGVDGEAGGFEVSIRQTGASALDGEVISLLLESAAGEFMVARFHGSQFQARTDTGLETLRTLHLADAALVVGARVGSARISTSPAPASGSFTSWLAGFPTITDPALMTPEADADGDGRSNKLEYATGGDPTAGGDPPACDIVPDGNGGLWVRFRRVPGIGSLRYTPQSSPDLIEPWQDQSAHVEPDPENPALLRLHLDHMPDSTGFFRLRIE